MCGHLGPCFAPCVHPGPQGSSCRGGGSDLGTVPGTCHHLDKLQQGLVRDPHPDQGTETALRAGTWGRRHRQLVRREKVEPLEE